LRASVDEAPGGYSIDEVALAKQRGSIDRLEQVALDERFPFPARLEAAGALADRGPKAQAERVLRRLGREKTRDVPAHERLIRFLHDAGRPADALATALDLLRTYGEDDSIQVAARQVRGGPSARRDGPARRRPHDESSARFRRRRSAPIGWRRCSSAHLNRKEDAEGLLLAHLARHPQAETAADVAEVRWRIHDDAGAADILAHPPALAHAQGLP